MSPQHFFTELTPDHICDLCSHYNCEVQSGQAESNTIARIPPWLDAIPPCTALDNEQNTEELSWAWLALGQQTTLGKHDCLWKCCLSEASGECYFLNIQVCGPAY